MNITEDDLPYNIQYGGLYDNDDNANGDGNETIQETDEMKQNEYNEYTSNHTIDLNNKAHINNDALLDHLHVFKRELYKHYVQDDTTHDPDDLGGIYAYHSILLECIGYWISLLDSDTKKMPEFEMNNVLQSEAQSIKTLIDELNKSHTSRPLAYNTLSKISIEDKFLLTQAK
jgi:hypothetical protein